MSVEASSVLANITLEQAKIGLDHLVSLHLVEEEGGRYRLQDLARKFVQQCGESLLSIEETTMSLELILDWYEQGVRDTSTSLSDHHRDDAENTGVRPDVPDHPAASAWLERELLNITSLVHFSAQHALSYAWRIPTLLQDYFKQSQQFDSWQITHEWGLEAAQKKGDIHAQARMLNGLALVLSELGNIDEAVMHVERALELLPAVDNDDDKAESLHIKATLHRSVGDDQAAYYDYLKSAATHASPENQQQYAQTLHDLGITCMKLSRFGEASTTLQRALLIQIELNDLAGQAATMTRLGELNRKLGRDDDAIAFCTQVTELRDREAVRYVDVLHALVLLSEISCVREEYEDALMYARQAVILCHSPQDHPAAARALISLVSALVGTGRMDQAQAEARHALALAAEVDTVSESDVRSKFAKLGLRLDP